MKRINEINKFSVDDVVFYGSFEGKVEQVKRIDGRNIIKSYFVYLVSFKDLPSEWINGIYLKRSE